MRNREAWQTRPGLILRSQALVLLAVCLAGCRTIGTINPTHLSEPGWRVRQGQAVWHLPGKRPELAGELIFAMNADGRCFLEFAKVPFPLMRAKCSDSRWEIEFPSQKLFFAGSGPPPKRWAWLQVCRGLTGKGVAPPWRFEFRADGNWRLDNARSKEFVEGFIDP